MDRDDVQLVVFADDWGRHPSSAQHLVGQLLPRTAGVLWVNTIGTRRPRLTLGDVRRGLGRLAAMLQTPVLDGPIGLPTNLQVIQPIMYPGFRAGWQRRFNCRQLRRCVAEAFGNWISPASIEERGRCVAVTTLPITADLVGRLPGIHRWVYYCVDDFSVWPGLDGGVMDAMERELVARVDAVIAVSQTLVERMRSMGRGDVALLTHGVDLEHWRVCDGAGIAPAAHGKPRFLFWGLIDERLDHTWCTALLEQGEVILCGPGSCNLPRYKLLGAKPYDELPGIATDAHVLIMPYIDAPVTRAMQPLKLLEYLATYRPVVVRELPATRAWADCCDVVATADEFVRVCRARAQTGLPLAQRAVRERRLPAESWAAKAEVFERVLREQAGGSADAAGGV